MSDSTPKFLEELAQYKNAHGDCKVPTNSRENPSLGRWVAAVRYKRKIGALPEDLVKKLDEMGFCWTPGNENWSKMFNALAEFKKKFNHCNVPEHWPDNPSLANWVQSQRHRRKKGLLAQERVADLDKMGFIWSIYKCEHKTPVPRVTAPLAVEHDQFTCEKIYVLSNGSHVPYSGTGPMPKELEQYAQAHKGELPPFIPMPSRPVVFSIGDATGGGTKIKWKGRGVVPPEVLAYLKENGTLPKYE